MGNGLVGTISGTVKHRVFNCVGKFFNVAPAQRKLVGRLMPQSIFTLDGRIYEPFVPHLVVEISKVCPLPGKKGAAELIAELRSGKLLAPLDAGNVYQAMLAEEKSLLDLASTGQNLRTLTRRQLALQGLVQELGYSAVENRKVATKCILQTLGFSGVRVYDLDLENRTWEHLYTEGEEGQSRFLKPKVPAEQSEKAFITKLAAGEVLEDVASRARRDGLYSWVADSHGWKSLHIPDRGKCDFVDKDQLVRDEEGDAAQGRAGVGSGLAREIFYLVFNGASEQHKEIYMITNWATGRPLFSNKAQDLALLRTFATSVARANQLVAAYQKLEDTSVHDELTRLHNRRYFNSKIESEFQRAFRYNHPFSFLMIDVDHFKSVNDTYSHEGGDYVLQEIAGLFLAPDSLLIRKKIDTIARWGGEEFAIILPETESEPARLVGDRIREAVSAHNFTYKGNGFPITISVGIATYPFHAKSIGDLIHEADTAMYKAKSKGRNTVVVAASPSAA